MLIHFSFSHSFCNVVHPVRPSFIAANIAQPFSLVWEQSRKSDSAGPVLIFPKMFRQYQHQQTYFRVPSFPGCLSAMHHYLAVSSSRLVVVCLPLLCFLLHSLGFKLFAAENAVEKGRFTYT